jgi:DNA-binding response OmpR family regulator
MAGKPLILVAAHDRVVYLLVAAALKPEGFRVVDSRAARPSSELLADLRPDVVILEAEEPPSRTVEAVARITDGERTPVMLLSAAASPTRVADGLDAGADDYLTRPFDPAELAARVRALVRRQKGRLHAGRRRIGSAVVDLDSRMIWLDGQARSLSRAEWTILGLLFEQEGHVLLHEELLSAAFGSPFRDDVAQLRLTVGRLRRKLGLAPWDEGAIRTIHGMGYAFDPENRLPRTWSGRRRPTRDEEDRGDREAAGAVDGARPVQEPRVGKEREPVMAHD